MVTEVRFTPRELGREIPFTIVEPEEGNIVLYSGATGTNEYRYQLIQDGGLLRLTEANPFLEEQSIVEERLVGLSSDWLESRSQGFENSLSFVETQMPGYGPDDIFVENKPFALRQIVDLIDNGDIELTPDFQRNFVWDKTRQSRLIESILLGLPLPSIYLSQYDDGRLTVVDGLQRLTTIRLFMKNDLRLSNLEYLREANGKNFSELTDVLSPLRTRRFSQTQVMCFVIDYRSPSKLKFDLFRRLNTGGKPLNNQEIRNCLSRREVQMILKEMVSLPSFLRATDYSVKDTRMDAREAALRFFYFYEQYSERNFIGDYNGDIESTLDSFTDQLNVRNTQDLNSIISIYDTGLTNAFHLFGSHCFRKLTRDSQYSRRPPINKLLMLTKTVLLSKYPINTIERMPFQALKEPIANLTSDDLDFFRAITWSTNSKWNINKAFRSLKGLFDQHLN